MVEQGWYKYNTDGASKGNLGRSSWIFCLRDAHGDLVHAEGSVIEDTNNMEAEAKALLYATIHCKLIGQHRVII